MKKILLLFVGLTGLFFSCSKDPAATTPACIQERISQLQAKAVQSPPAEVKEYLYNDRKVYFFTADCCDQYDLLLDENCNTVCAASGGIAGHGDGKCEDFDKRAKFLRVVWKDGRTK